METERPTVSVVIPTYNRPDLIGGAIQSVLNQTYSDFEIIVVDDGIEKRADDVIEAFCDNRIRYIAHEENKGCSAAKNTGARAARGRFVAFLDDDDVWLPNKLAAQVSALKEAPSDVGFSFHAAVEHFDHGDHTTVVPEGVGNYLDQALRKFSGFIASSLMIKKEVFAQVGYLDESFPSHTDIEFILRVIKDGWRGVGINEPLVRRAGGSGHIQMGSNYRNRIHGRNMLLTQYAEEFEKRPTYLAKHLEQLARFYRDIGEYKEARRAFWRSFRLQPRIGRLLHAAFPFIKRHEV